MCYAPKVVAKGGCRRAAPAMYDSELRHFIGACQDAGGGGASRDGPAGRTGWIAVLRSGVPARSCCSACCVGRGRGPRLDWLAIRPAGWAPQRAAIPAAAATLQALDAGRHECERLMFRGAAASWHRRVDLPRWLHRSREGWRNRGRMRGHAGRPGELNESRRNGGDEEFLIGTLRG
jgi:hypothetical protein